MNRILTFLSLLLCLSVHAQPTPVVEATPAQVTAATAGLPFVITPRRLGGGGGGGVSTNVIQMTLWTTNIVGWDGYGTTGNQVSNQIANPFGKIPIYDSEYLVCIHNDAASEMTVGQSLNMRDIYAPVAFTDHLVTFTAGTDYCWVSYPFIPFGNFGSMEWANKTGNTGVTMTSSTNFVMQITIGIAQTGTSVFTNWTSTNLTAIVLSQWQIMTNVTGDLTLTNILNGSTLNMPVGGTVPNWNGTNLMTTATPVTAGQLPLPLPPVVTNIPDGMGYRYGVSSCVGPSFFGTTSTSSIDGVNRYQFLPMVIYNTQTFTNVIYSINSLAVTEGVKGAIYSSSTNGMPQTLVANLFTNFPSAAGVYSNYISVTLSPGLYWTACCFSNSGSCGTVSISTDFNRMGFGFSIPTAAQLLTVFGGPASVSPVGTSSGSALRIVNAGGGFAVFPTNSLASYPLAAGAGFDTAGNSCMVLLFQ